MTIELRRQIQRVSTFEAGAALTEDHRSSFKTLQQALGNEAPAVVPEAQPFAVSLTVTRAVIGRRFPAFQGLSQLSKLVLQRFHDLERLVFGIQGSSEGWPLRVRSGGGTDCDPVFQRHGGLGKQRATQQGDRFRGQDGQVRWLGEQRCGARWAASVLAMIHCLKNRPCPGR